MDNHQAEMDVHVVEVEMLRIIWFLGTRELYVYVTEVSIRKALTTPGIFFLFYRNSKVTKLQQTPEIKIHTVCR